jgi:hypothetical protein
MAFDAKVFADWHARTRCYSRWSLRREKFREKPPNLTLLWAVARSELTNLIKKVTQGMLDRIPESEIHKITKLADPVIDPKNAILLNLVKRLHAFPTSLSYRINKEGTVLIYSSDRYLEGALYFGTRQLPRLRPIDYLVSRLGLRLQDRSIVFMARDFRKPHETEEDFKRENLRQVSTHYA